MLLSLLAGSVWSPAIADESLNFRQIKILRERGEIVPLSTILLDARQRYRGGRLLEAELEQENGGYIYELEFLDQDDVLHELYYDAKTGELQAYEVYETTDGKLRTIKYGAHTNAPVAVEVEVKDSQGNSKRQEYDIKTGELLRREEN